MIVIILVNYNNNDDTIDCVKSIQSSVGIEPPFIVVIDNDSKIKNIHEGLNFYANKKVIYSKENIGFGKANNLGISWARSNKTTDLIFILNNDTIIFENTLRTLLEVMKTTGSSVATPLIKVFNNPGEIWYAGGYINYKRMSPIVNISLAGNSLPFYTDFASGCAIMIKKEVFDKIGAFDPFYFMYDEDVELSIRLKKNSYPILFVPKSIVYHKCQGSQVQKDISVPSNQLSPYHPGLKFYLRNTIINRRYTLKKHLVGMERCFNYIPFYFYWFLKSFQYLIHKKPDVSILTIKLLFKHLDI